jgi:flagellar basal-body rod modification protein FlgD
MGTTVNAVSAGTDAGAAAGPSAPAVKEAASQETFLKLLVAQIKYQDPLNPADSIQFVSQLAQFSELEQVIGIRTEIGLLREQFEQAAASEESQP